MPFRFPLETVLRLRASQEHQQELLLQAANQQVLRIREHLAHVERLRTNLSVSRESLLTEGMQGAEMHFFDECRGVLEYRKDALNQELAEAQKAVAQRLAAFEKARRQRKLVEELRERHKQNYRQRENRREQRSLDDLYLILRAGRPPG